MTKQRLTKKVHELKELKAQAATLEERITAIESEIKQEMKRLDKQEMQVDIFTVRYKELVKQAFNTKAFKMKYEDLYNQFTAPKAYKRLTIN